MVRQQRPLDRILNTGKPRRKLLLNEVGNFKTRGIIQFLTYGILQNIDRPIEQGFEGRRSMRL